MYKILYSQRAKDTLDLYFDAFKSYYTRLYSDTGIFSESTIRQGYLDMADNLFLIIDSHIHKRLENDEVYGKRPNLEIPGEYILITEVEKRTLIIDYTEDSESFTRTIIQLRIFRE